MDVWLIPILQVLVWIVSIGLTSTLLAKATMEIEKKLDSGLTGGLILGLINSLPETIIITEAVLSGANEVAVGSITGSLLFIFTFGIGLISVVYYFRYKSKTIQIDGDISSEYTSLLIALVTFTLVLLVFRSVNYYASILLLIPYVYYVYRRYRGRRVDVRREFNVRKTILLLSIGAVMLFLISNFFVSSLVSLSTVFNIPTVVLASVLVPIASELGDGFLALSLLYNSASNVDTVITNFMGGKLENLTLLLSIPGFYTTVNLVSNHLDVILIPLSVLSLLMIIRDKNIKISEGLALITIYPILILFLLLR
ncbi:membrane protein [Sulfolobus acidocaldarius SUSAZ]|nr:membrane protein [Sulfolobus acidocaldarius SUSAZ]